MRAFLAPILAWIALLVLLAAEAFGTLRVGLGNAAPFVGLTMAAIVALVFMRARTTTSLSQFFLIAGVFWLIVLLGLGIMDPITRHDVATSRSVGETPANASTLAPQPLPRL